MMKNNLKGKWLWIDSPQRNQPNQYAEFRMELPLAAAPGKAALRLSVDTDFVVWVNGSVAGCGQFTDFPDQRTYSEMDVAAQLEAGRNVIAILVHYCGVDHFSYLPGDAGLWCELEIDGRVVASNEAPIVCRPSPCYRAEQTVRIDAQRGFTFHYDASGEDDWRSAGYRCGPSWRSAAAIELSGPPQPRPLKMLTIGPVVSGSIIAQGLLRRMAQPDRTVADLMQEDFLSARRSWELFDDFAPISTPALPPVTLSESKLAGSDGMYLLFDLGQEECGLPELELDCTGSCVIDIAIGEHLDDLRVRSSIGGRNFACRYVARRGRQRFVHYLDRYAGRYVQLHITQLRGAVQLLSAGLLRTEYPVSFAGEFASADSLCDQIWRTSRRTLHLCMFEHYEDCPWREQGLYANDSRNQMLCGYYAFGDYSFAKVSLDLLGRSTGPDGYQELCAPMKCPITIPSFTMTWFLAMNDYLMYSGDAAFIADSFPRMQRMLESYRLTLKDGLLPSPSGKRYWHLYDWAEGLDGTEQNDCRNFAVVDRLRFDAPLNLFYVMVLQSVANMALVIGKESFAAQCLEQCEKLKSAAHQAFWNAERKAYTTYQGQQTKPHYAELVQSLAMLAGVGNQTLHRDLRQKLMSEKNGLVATTLSQSLYKFEAILLDDSCGPFVRDSITRTWSRMLFSGATSFWETLQGGWDFNHAGSLCHGWSGIPAYFYGAYGLGVKPLTPGFTRVALKPMLGMGALRGAVPTPRGAIRIALDQQEQGGYGAQLQTPASTEVEADRSQVAECRVGSPSGVR